MITYKINDDFQQQLDNINKKLEQAHTDESAQFVSTKPEADEFWNYLKKCEQHLVLKTFYSQEHTHEMENILALYHLNNLIDHGHLTILLREVFGLPRTEVLPEMLDEKWNLAGWVAGDGTIYSFSRYCQLDYRWSLVLCYYYYYKLFPKKKHPFVKAPLDELYTTGSTSATVAVIGDWGTGAWKDGKKHKCPAELVIDGVLDMQPDYIIHLGDVYYAGTPDEERNNFLKLLEILPASYHNKVYTMNSNHEMYDGANGLLGTTLQDPKFSQQCGSSYFALPIGDWLLIGLDSAYYDKSALYMKGSLGNAEVDKEQLNFLQKAYKTGKKIMLMTHHNGIEVVKDGPSANNLLWDQVFSAMEQNLPEAWYWGHVHNGIVYRDNLPFYNDKKSGEKRYSKMRCCGHASIPFGDGPYLKKFNEGINPEVQFYTHTDMPEPTDEVQKLRVINGFAIVEINSSSFKETFYEVSNANPKPKKVWESS